MLWPTLLIVCSVKCLQQTDVILSPKFNDVLENSTLELTCHAANYDILALWQSVNQPTKFSVLYKTLEEGTCEVRGFLAEIQYFDTRCFINGTFKVKIKRVDKSYHGQEWFCFSGYTKSNTALINVQVPIKYVTFENIAGDVLKTVEKIKFTLSCETSEGRPAANVTWIKISKNGITTNVTNDVAYAVSTKETLTERNMTIVTSSIDIEPVREDNGTRIICEATNRKSYVVRKEIMLYVQFPPTKPCITWQEGNYTVNETLYAIRNDNVMLLCHSYGDPAPHYQWIGQSAGPTLHIESIQTYTNKTCRASNEMRETTGGEQASFASTTVSIIVSYPPGSPYLEFNGRTEVMKDGIFLRNKIIIKESNTFTVTCKADGFPPPVFTWNNQDGRNSPDLIFTNITKDFSGLYTCFAENVIRRSFPAYEVTKNTSTDLEIAILYQCTIENFYVIDTEKRTVSEVTENETIIFSCDVDSNPESEIILMFGEKELRRNLSIKSLTHTHRVTSCLDDGVYKCIAKNKFNSKPVLKQFKLTVRCTPVASPEFDLKANVSSEQNVTIDFQFKAFAYPTPEFHWFKLNGSSWNKLKSSNKYEIHTVDPYSSLTVRSITEDDYGIYKLRIQNNVGALEQLYFLKANVTSKEQGLLESSTATIYISVTVATVSFIILAAVSVSIIYRHISREHNDWRPNADVNVNPTTSSHDDNSLYYEEIEHVYEQVNEHFTEGAVYMEMQSIKSEDSTEFYITPVI